MSAFFVALPFVIVAVLCALFAGIVGLCYGGIKRRGVKREGFDYDTDHDADDLSEASSYDLNGTGCLRILSGVVMFGLAAHFVGLAFVANHFFYSGVANVIDLSESATTSITTEAVGVLQVVRNVLVRVDSLARQGVPIPVAEFNPIRLANNLIRAQQQFRATAGNVVMLTGQFRTYGNIAFWLAAGVYIVLVIGVLLLFSTAFPRRKHQRIAMSIYVVPFVMSWLCVAIITASATVAGDLCVQLSDFQKIVLVQANSRPPSLLADVNVQGNLLIKNNVQCPQQLVGSGIPLAATANTIGNVLQTDFSVGVLRMLYPNNRTTEAELDQVRRWLVPAIRNVVDCSIVTRLAGQYMYTFCGHRGPITAMFVAWGSLLALAILLTIAYLLTQFTYFEASRFLTPYIKPDEDIYEAFSGVFGRVSERQSKDAGQSEPGSAKAQKSEEHVALPVSTTTEEPTQENVSKRSSGRSSRRSSKRVPSSGFPATTPRSVAAQPATNVFRMPGEELPTPITETAKVERRTSATANPVITEEPAETKGNRRFLARRSPKAYETVAAAGMDITDKGAAGGTAVVAGAAAAGAAAGATVAAAAAANDSKRKRGKRFAKKNENEASEASHGAAASGTRAEENNDTTWVAGSAAAGRRGKKLFGRGKEPGAAEEEGAATSASATAAEASKESRRAARRAEKAAAKAAAKAEKTVAAAASASAPAPPPANAPAPPPPPPGLVKPTKGKSKSPPPPPPPTATQRTGASAMMAVPPSRPVSTSAPIKVNKNAPPPPPPIPGLVKPTTGKSKAPPPPPPPSAPARPAAPPPPPPAARPSARPPPPPPQPIKVNKNAPPPPPPIPGLVKPTAGGRGRAPPPPPPPPMRR